MIVVSRLTLLRSNTLYNLWNAYEPRLPQDYYLDRLLNTGDFLYAIKVKYHKIYYQYFIKAKLELYKLWGPIVSITVTLFTQYLSLRELELILRVTCSEFFVIETTSYSG